MMRRILLCAAALCAGLAAAPGSARAAAEFLEPEVAFKHSARVLDANTLEVNFRIVDGYYLYREKFRFAIAPSGVTLGAPQLPPGKAKIDEFFGRVETYRGNLRILLPIKLAAGGAQPVSSVKLTTTYQGCDDGEEAAPAIAAMPPPGPPPDMAADANFNSAT